MGVVEREHPRLDIRVGKTAIDAGMPDRKKPALASGDFDPHQSIGQPQGSFNGVGQP